MNFEVNGQAYFLNFSEKHGEWFVIQPTMTGVVALPVYMDERDFEPIGFSPEVNNSSRPN